MNDDEGPPGGGPKEAVGASTTPGASTRRGQELPLRLAPFWVQALIAASGTTLFILWVRNQWGGEWLTTEFTDLASIIVPLGAAWAAFGRAQRAIGDLRVGWRLVGSACVAWAAGQTVWTVIEFTTRNPPVTPSWADAGYLSFVPLAAFGVLKFVRSDGSRAAFFRPFLDGAIIASSFIGIAFVFGLERIVLASAQTDLALTVNLLYPFGDALVLGIVLLRLSRAPPAARPSLGLLAVGAIALAVADLWFLVVDSQGTYNTGGVLDAFWIIGFQLIGLAAVRPGNLSEALEAPKQTPALALVPLYPFALAAGSVCYAEWRDGGVLSDTLFWTAFVIVMLVFVRLMIMLLDNIRLKEREEAATAALLAEKEVRTRMMNAITHDMLNAMSPIRIQMRLLSDGMLGNLSEKQSHAITIVGRNAEQMARLATDIKDGANVEEGRLALLPAQMDLADLVRDAVLARQPEAQQRQVGLEAERPAAWPMRGDAGRLTQVVDNLLSNALKFTKPGGKIRVRLSTTGAEARVEVQDDGRGLTPDEQARLFRPFSQVHARDEIKEQGTGLGLYICKGIIERHGGRIGVTSEGHGKGSTFWFVLPADSLQPVPTIGAARPESGR